MSAVLDKKVLCSKPALKKRGDWAAWRVSDDEVRVQVNRPDIARAFAALKSVSLVGYSVAGNYLKLFCVKKTVPEVEAWMKDFVRHATTGEIGRKELN
jgi:hypothetical protein